MTKQIVGASDALASCLAYVSALAPSDAAVLILGESGVGKELIAQRIHAQSARSKGALVTVNCASVPRELFESEFFGHVKGAFTNAVSDRIGRFESADGGTLFLDEVGEIPAECQGKLLRALQDSTFSRVGESETRHVDVRVIAATNRNLAVEVETGRFRRDLFYRISTFMVEVPPLRDRKSDIELLADAILGELAHKYETERPKFSQRDLSRMLAYDWPGNIRELKNVIERAFVLGRSKGSMKIALAMPGVGLPAMVEKQEKRRPFMTAPELVEFERDNLVSALETANWKVSGENGAAALLQMKPTTLASRMKALCIKRPETKSLYMRLGGERLIAGFARDLLGRLQADPQLSRFWRNRSNVSLSREEQMLTRYLSAALGGPRLYDGDSMTDVHADLGITSGDWIVFRRHLQDAFNTFAIEDRAREELSEMVESLRSNIVAS